uniref:HTH psq-type domain-containing protein n=1 Tax=Lygus hesperus TaxID=30085 RepID=A0A0K8T922_LYGHE
MPRRYVRKVGPRMLFKYEVENLNRAISAVKRRNLSLRKAAETFNVPKSTLARHLSSKKELLPHGGQKILTDHETQTLANCVKLCGEWGFPLNVSDIRDIVKSYLDRHGRTEQRFVDNRPGRDWAIGFLRSHSDLTMRLCENVKRARNFYEI